MQGLKHFSEVFNVIVFTTFHISSPQFGNYGNQFGNYGNYDNQWGYSNQIFKSVFNCEIEYFCIIYFVEAESCNWVVPGVWWKELHYWNPKRNDK